MTGWRAEGTSNTFQLRFPFETGTHLHCSPCLFVSFLQGPALFGCHFPPVTYTFAHQENRTRSFLCRGWCYPELHPAHRSALIQPQPCDSGVKGSSSTVPLLLSLSLPTPPSGPCPAPPRIADPTYPAGPERGGPTARARPPRAPSSRGSSARRRPSPAAPPPTESGGGSLRLRLPPSCAPEPRRPRLTRPPAGGGTDGGWWRPWRAGPGHLPARRRPRHSGPPPAQCDCALRAAGRAVPVDSLRGAGLQLPARPAPRWAAALARLAKANSRTSFPSGLQRAGSSGVRLPGWCVGAAAAAATAARSAALGWQWRSAAGGERGGGDGRDRARDRLAQHQLPTEARQPNVSARRGPGVG